MNWWILISRSLRFHAKSHLGAGLGAAIGSAVLIGALVMGDSVRGSLRGMALARVQGIELALASEDRFFRAALADAVAEDLATKVAPGMQVLGTASRTDAAARANQVQVLGVTPEFWALADAAGELAGLRGGEVALNRRLAEQLNAGPGDVVLLRVTRPSGLSREAAIAPQEDATQSLRLQVARVVGDAEMGRFSLRASQIPPFNAFVPLGWLQEALDLAGRANLLLVGTREGLSAAAAQAAVKAHWQLADAELELRELPGTDELELRTGRVFLDEAVTEASLGARSAGRAILTYFVNELRAGERYTPYSMVTAMGAPVVPAEMGDEEILVNEWLAEDLRLKAGDIVELRYFTMGLGRGLEEAQARFRVHGVIPLSGAAADRELMPGFPGIEQAESTRDWDPSLPVELSRIRPKDERYWEEHRGTPKAFVTLAAGQRLWANRYGNLTAVRYPAGASASDLSAGIAGDLLARLDPAAVGLRFESVRQQALAAAAESQDFGGLFLGFSFFLVVAALLLMALLFQFAIEQRSAEVGTMLALGFTPRQVRRLLWCEGGALAALGSVIGLLGGVVYARLMLAGLTTIWRDAVGTSALTFHAEPATLVIGALAGTVVAWATVALALRRQARQPARELLAESAGEDQAPSVAAGVRGVWLALGLSVMAAGLTAFALARVQEANPGLFFGAGALWLMAGLAAGSVWMGRLAAREGAGRLTLWGMGIRNVTRRRRRSLATLGLLACGSFLIASIGVFRLDAVRDADRRSSGTGGYALVGESTLPVVHDLNTATGREFYALEEADLAEAEVLAFRVRDGDDASCLNLNRAQQPRLLGVPTAKLAARGAFTFAKVAGDSGEEHPWELLRGAADNAGDSGAAVSGREIPAVGDVNSIVWAMGKKVGDTLDYVDDRGRPFRVRIVGALANSILQGSLLIDEEAFVRLFPSEVGYRMFLVDAPSKDADRVAGTLSRALVDEGLELTPATRRLAQFNAVQNTYLSTFQVLGGLGLVLGSVGLGVVLMRNVFERRGELALLLAVGYRPSGVRWMVLSEHGLLLLAGLVVGLAAAAVAVVPSIRSSELPYASLGLTLAAVLASGVLWTWGASRWSLRGELLPALRRE
ncbi:MAG: ABC transporter permease [Verrucomicrobia bacterium]|nr:ABC transporter permease [Verrucomicrobiota bacterium]